MSKSIASALCFIFLIAIACTSSQVLQPFSPFEQTRTALVASASADALLPIHPIPNGTIDSSIDPFSLTATSIIATATAQVSGITTDTCRIDIITVFSYGNDGNYQEPSINDRLRGYNNCDEDGTLPLSHEIVILEFGFVPEWLLIQTLEDAISRLPQYPPFNAQLSSNIDIISYYRFNSIHYARFSYSDAIAAYESGLRGTELAAALGLQDIPLTATAFNQEATQQEATQEREYELQLTRIHETRLTATAYILALPTLNAEQGQVIRQTQSSLIEQEHALSTSYASTRVVLEELATAHAEASAQGTNPYELTSTAFALTPTATPYDYFSLTATMIVSSATAQMEMQIAYAITSPTPCITYQWTEVNFRYFENMEDDLVATPEITEFVSSYCDSRRSFNYYEELLLSHEIFIYPRAFHDAESFYNVLEDAISRLPDYPPALAEVSEMIRVIFEDKGYWSIGLFTYSDAIAAYESGLRGAELAETLGIEAP